MKTLSELSFDFEIKQTESDRVFVRYDGSSAEVGGATKPELARAYMLLAKAIEEGKSELVIAIGCTGGKHRSVTIAEEINKLLQSRDVKAVIRHRDMTKD